MKHMFANGAIRKRVNLFSEKIDVVVENITLYVVGKRSMCSFVRRIVYEFDCFRGEIYNVHEFVTIVSTIIVFDVDDTVERVQLLLQELPSLWQAVFFSLHRAPLYFYPRRFYDSSGISSKTIFLFFFLFLSRKRERFFNGIRVACTRPGHKRIFSARLYNKTVFHCYVPAAQTPAELPSPRRGSAAEQRSRVVRNCLWAYSIKTRATALYRHIRRVRTSTAAFCRGEDKEDIHENDIWRPAVFFVWLEF